MLRGDEIGLAEPTEAILEGGGVHGRVHVGVCGRWLGHGGRLCSDRRFFLRSGGLLGGLRGVVWNFVRDVWQIGRRSEGRAQRRSVERVQEIDGREHGDLIGEFEKVAIAGDKGCALIVRQGD